MVKRILNSHLESAVVAVFLVITFVIFREYRFWDFDDSYIVYRIVDNILSGHGWVYNLDERYNASTSVLNTLLIALVGFFTGDIPGAAHVLGSIAIFVAALLTYDLIKTDYGMPLAVAAALLVSGLLSGNETWGLEPNLFAALILLFVWLESKRLNTWYLLGFIFLARPDGLLLFAFKGLLEMVRTRNLPVRGPLQSLAVVAPWLLFSLAYFGQLMPETLGNKMWQGDSGFWGRGNIYYQGLTAHILALGSLLIPIVCLSLLGFLVAIWQKSTLVYLFLFAVLQQLFYVAINVPAYHWYFATFDLALLLAVINGTCWLLSWEVRFNSHLLRYAALAFVVMFGIERAVTVLQADLRDPRDLAYKALSARLDADKAPPGMLAALEVGTIGFFQDRKIIDMVSLTSENPEFISGIHVDLFYEIAPKIVVVHNPVWPMEEAVYYDPRFDALYELGGQVDAAVSTRYFLRRTDDPQQIADLTEQAVVPPDLLQVPFPGFSSTQACVLDGLNGTQIQRETTVQWRRSLEGVSVMLRGWMFDAIPGQQPPISVGWVDEDAGQIYFTQAIRVKRLDVAAAHGSPFYADSGFQRRVDLDQLPNGRYQLAAYHADSNKVCRLAVGFELKD
ncbi:MAG: hypothetical protein ACFHX7_06325 [Pseudomonadota bacterium]